MRTHFSFAVALAIAGAACGDDGSTGSAADAADAAIDAVTDVGPVDGRMDAEAPDATSSDMRDAGPADGGDGGLFTPGDPPTGSPELEIFAARNPENLAAQARLRQGDLVYWECGFQAPGIGHVRGSFRLATPELEGLTPEGEAEIESTTLLQLIDRNGFVIAQNEGLAFSLDFGTPGAVSAKSSIQIVLNRDVVGDTTKPSDVDGEMVRYRVQIRVPGGSTFEREVWVDTLVPDSQLGLGC